MKQIADLKRTEHDFEVGDLVYLRLQPYRQMSVQLRRNLKLAPKFYGPYRVVQKVGKVAYKLELLPNSKIHPVFYVSLLKNHIGNTVKVSTVLPALDKEGQLMGVRLAILEWRIYKKNNAMRVQFLIH